MNTFMKILGAIAIILGIVLIIQSWQYPFFVLGSMFFGGGAAERMLKGILAILIYILVTGGLIVSGIAMMRRKSWAVVLFVILAIFWGIILAVLFNPFPYEQTIEGQHKQMEERIQRELQELQRQREYLRLQKEK